MAKPKICCGGEIKLSTAEKKRWENAGWLGEGGLCQFPEAVQASLMDVRLRGLPPKFWETATDEKIKEAVKKGWIVFVDGNGDELTSGQWKAKYVGFPDPVDLAMLLQKLPPNVKKYRRIGTY